MILGKELSNNIVLDFQKGKGALMGTERAIGREDKNVTSNIVREAPAVKPGQELGVSRGIDESPCIYTTRLWRVKPLTNKAVYVDVRILSQKHYEAGRKRKHLYFCKPVRGVVVFV